MVTRIAELEIARHQRELIFKPLAAHVFGATPTAAVPTAMTTGADAELDELPEGWFDHGLIDRDDAITWGREMERADINAIGYNDPVRSDVTSDIFGLTFKGLETNRFNIENYLQVDLSAVVPTATTGEVNFIQPTTTFTRRRRLFTIAEDGAGADKIFIGRLVALAEVTETPEQTITTQEGALTWPCTFNSRVDTTLGYSVRHFFGGPGWRAKLEEAGFPALAP